MAKGACGWDGCGRAARKRGYCNTHYERLRRGGQITVDRETDPAARFWSRVQKSDGCWIWTASRSTGGYGRVWWDGRLQQAHRIACELLVGPIPEGLELDHLCRVRPCVNPAHLEPVTSQVNLLRGVGASAKNAQATHCRNGHPLVEGFMVYRKKVRVCLICQRQAGLRRAADEKAKRAQIVKLVRCVQCGAEFSYIGHVRQICSDDCRRARAVVNSQAYQARKRR